MIYTIVMFIYFKIKNEIFNIVDIYLIKIKFVMLYQGYDTYGYEEPEELKTLAERKGFEFPKPKNVDEPVFDGDSFYTENGQQLTDLVQPEL